MTDRDKAIKALGFLQGLSVNIWRDYDDGVAESFDKAIKDIEEYVEGDPIDRHFATPKVTPLPYRTTDKVVVSYER